MARAGFLEMGTLLCDSSSWILGCGPATSEQDPYYAEVRLADWPMRLYSKLDTWNEFADGGYREGLTGQALVAADKVMRQVSTVAPDPAAIRKLRRERFTKDARQTGRSSPHKPKE